MPGVVIVDHGVMIVVTGPDGRAGLAFERRLDIHALPPRAKCRMVSDVNYDGRPSRRRTGQNNSTADAIVATRDDDHPSLRLEIRLSVNGRRVAS